ncbi:hypothetical protein ACOME3_006170 [Neoechinorhynchus agilis]
MIRDLTEALSSLSSDLNKCLDHVQHWYNEESNQVPASALNCLVKLIYSLGKQFASRSINSDDYLIGSKICLIALKLLNRVDHKIWLPQIQSSCCVVACECLRSARPKNSLKIISNLFKHHILSNSLCETCIAYLANYHKDINEQYSFDFIQAYILCWTFQSEMQINFLQLNNVFNSNNNWSMDVVVGAKKALSRIPVGLKRLACLRILTMADCEFWTNNHFVDDDKLFNDAVSNKSDLKVLVNHFNEDENYADLQPEVYGFFSKHMKSSRRTIIFFLFTNSSFSFTIPQL